MTRRRSVRKIRRGGVGLYSPFWLLLPASLMIGFILVIPLGYTVYLSFFKENLFARSPIFVGIKNYGVLFKDKIFWISFRQSAIFTLGSVSGEYLLGLGSALLLYKSLRGQTIWRALILFPWVVPIIVSTLVWKWMLTPRYGIINNLIVNLGLPSKFWLGDPKVVMPTVIFINIWRSFPFFTIVILAGLQAISLDVLEAASIDGASGWKKFRYIILPHIRGISATVVILHIILTFGHFDTIWFLTRGGPSTFTEVLPTYMYRQAFMFYEVGYASTLAVWTVAIIATITVFLYYTFYSSKRSR